MTAFTTHFCKSWLRELNARGRMIAWWLRLALLVGALAGLWAPATGFADQAQSRSEIADFKLHQTADGLLLSTSMRFELPDQVEDLDGATTVEAAKAFIERAFGIDLPARLVDRGLPGLLPRPAGRMLAHAVYAEDP